ncbi:DUF4153 domain-containing protein [Sphingomonas sp. RB1R13]|uniref:DUF4153 domain-containing protein n=1 Tax=Sphingomonas sp. RB1R13 TaxID=3096159 RepID=UPI002FC93DA8
MRNERHDAETSDWPLRPWILAGVCALAGLTFQRLAGRYLFAETAHAWREPVATAVAIAALSFSITVEQKRLWWSAAFALAWGAVIGLVGYFTLSYNHIATMFEWPFLSGLFAVLLAAPLFQTVRDAGAWRFDYVTLHRHAWSDAVIGFAGLVFVGIAFILAWLLAALFDLIGIDVLKQLMKEDWFGWILAGFSFGSAVGLLRERDALVANLQRLVTVVLSVLAPVLAVGLGLFLLSLPFTGLGKLWASSLPTTPLMLSAAAFAVLLTNAVIGDGVGNEDRRPGRILQQSALLLCLCVLPLAVIGAVSLAQRVDQHGWTPERIWGVLCVAVALIYGAAGWWSVARGRMDFDALLRPLQIKMALGLCAVALFLALPILDFGAISTRSQMDRLARGLVTTAKFDWRAMAFSFGPAGRRDLKAIAEHGPVDQRPLASAALAAKNRWQVDDDVGTVQAAGSLDHWLRMVPATRPAPPALRDAIAQSKFCRDQPCAAIWVDDQRVLIAGERRQDIGLSQSTFILRKEGNWEDMGDYMAPPVLTTPGQSQPEHAVNVATAPIDLRTVQRRQLVVDGKPVGEPFE